MAALQVPWFLLASVVVISQLLVPVVSAVGNVNSSTAPSSPMAAPGPGCSTKCGNVQIPYPFGLSDECSWKGQFTLTCNNSFSPPRPFWVNIEVIDVSLERGEMRLFSPVAFSCYNSPNTTTPNGVVGWSIIFMDSPLLISSTRNEFTAIGCNTVAFIQGREDWSFFTGCISSCPSLHDAAEDGAECTGLGCCQTRIPGNLSLVDIFWDTNATNAAWRYSPCSYAFVAEKGWYHFKRRDLTRLGNKNFTDRVGERTIPVVIDWAIRPETNETSANSSGSACVSNHSYWINATQGPGYLCKCSKGYNGNPYVIGGCTNINECQLRKLNPKIYEKLYPCAPGSKCHDMPGDYKCKCSKWYQRGDGRTVKGCQSIFPAYAIAIIATFVAVLLPCLAIIHLMRWKQRERFSRNGGDILKAQGIIIFTEGEVKKITRSYSNRIGGGFFGDVYKGTIDGAKDQVDVAVKCTVAKKVARSRLKTLHREASQKEQEESWKDGFTKEISFQFRIQHPNVVRLVGCCLETDVPILVFELVPNGSLEEVLHGGKKDSTTLSLLKRLDIAIGSAEALSFIHTHGDHQHVHGDVKPANILLDDNLEPKVSDFGSSKLLSVNMYAREVAADGKYADPMYYRTGCFTVKSDVYSFGVVLLELITGKTATYGINGGNILTVDFKKACKTHGSGRTMYDEDILWGDNNEDAQYSHRYMECLDMIGALAVRCLSEDADERPTMAEVVVELKQVKNIIAHGVSCSEAI